MTLRARLFEIRLTAWAASVILALSVLLLRPTNVFAQRERDEELRLLTAMGTAELRVRPNLAHVRIGVETEAPTATEAREQNANRAGRVVNALRSLGIPEQAIETAVFQLQPIRRYEDDSRRGEPPIVGYRVANVVQVRTEVLDLIPRIIDEGVRAGANRVEGVDFTLKDETGPRQTALRQAVANARASAQSMAQELGVQLIRIHNVQQGGIGVMPPPMFLGAVRAEVMAPTPIFPGDVTVSASATLTYLIQ